MTQFISQKGKIDEILFYETQIKKILNTYFSFIMIYVICRRLIRYYKKREQKKSRKVCLNWNIAKKKKNKRKIKIKQKEKITCHVNKIKVE